MVSLDLIKYVFRCNSTRSIAPAHTKVHRSHEINKIEILDDEELKQLMPWDKVDEHRQRALSPLHPRLV